ncbi:MAG TPA: adenosylmethionine--8-amino-7-oxononanoate aminotransferase BioA, partial [Burkholderiales bacterium]
MNPDYTRNADWLSRSLEAVWHPCTQMKHHEQLPLVPIARGEGMWLYDFDGNRY